MRRAVGVGLGAATVAGNAYAMQNKPSGSLSCANPDNFDGTKCVGERPAGVSDLYANPLSTLRGGNVEKTDFYTDKAEMAKWAALGGTCRVSVGEGATVARFGHSGRVPMSARDFCCRFCNGTGFTALHYSQVQRCSKASPKGALASTSNIHWKRL